MSNASMISFIKMPFSEDKVFLSVNSSAGQFVVFIGENGTGKSYLLKNLLDEAVNILTDNFEGQSFLEQSFRVLPSKIIAISALPSDRFPSKSSYFDPYKSKKYDIDAYKYIGPRTSRNIISRNQSVRELISSILNNPDSIDEKKAYLTNLCKQVGISSRFSFGLNPTSGSNGGIRRYIEESQKKMQIRFKKSNFSDVGFDALLENELVDEFDSSVVGVRGGEVLE